jgi:hypothetical protein
MLFHIALHITLLFTMQFFIVNHMKKDISKAACTQRQSGVASPEVTGSLSLNFHLPFFAFSRQSLQMQYLLRYFLLLEPE